MFYAPAPATIMNVFDKEVDLTRLFIARRRSYNNDFWQRGLTVWCYTFRLFHFGWQMIRRSCSIRIASGRNLIYIRQVAIGCIWDRNVVISRQCAPSSGRTTASLPKDARREKTQITKRKHEYRKVLGQTPKSDIPPNIAPKHVTPENYLYICGSSVTLIGQLATLTTFGAMLGGIPLYGAYSKWYLCAR